MAKKKSIPRIVKEWARAELACSNTREAYTDALYRFLDWHKATPAQTLRWSVKEANARMKHFKLYLRDYISPRTGRNLAGSTKLIIWSGLKSWFGSHNRPINERLKGIRTTKTILDYIPTKDDVALLLGVNHGRYPMVYKTAIALMAFSGMRPVDLMNLRYGSIRASYEKRDEEVLTLTQIQQKTDAWYTTYLGPEGLRYLRKLLEDRKARGERIRDSSFVVSPDGRRLARHTFKRAMQAIIERTIGRHPTGEPFRRFRPYCLRKYFRLGVNSLGQDLAEFLMGHKKGLESLSATYFGLRDQDPRALERLKQEYIRVLPQLETGFTRPAGAKKDLLDRIDRLEAAVRLMGGIVESTDESLGEVVIRLR